MTGVRLKLLAECRIADIVIQAELRIRDMGARDVLEVDGALDRVHLLVVEVDAELKVGDGEVGDAEMPLAGIAFGCGQNGVRALLRVVDFRGLPVREKEGVVVANLAELRGLENLAAVHLPDDIGVQQTAWHLTLQKDVVRARRNDQLCAQSPPIVFLLRRRGDAVAIRRVGEADSPAATSCTIVDGTLNRLRVIRQAIALRAKIQNIETE